MGAALWGDPHAAARSVRDTWGAVAILDLTEDRRVNRAARALLDLSGRLGNPDVARREPFYQLSPGERFVLVTIHVSHWPYARVAQVLGAPAEGAGGVESLLWQARLRLAGTHQYPSGSKLSGTDCPEYDLTRPWTQRFLDEEIPAGRELVFIQGHLLRCESCRTALTRCREMVYDVDAKIPEQVRGGGFLNGMLLDLRRIDREGRGLREPAQRTFTETLVVFGARREVRIALGVGVALLAVALIRG